MLKRFTSDKINGTKYALFFLSRTPTHHSFTFDSQFFYELNTNSISLKVSVGIFYFRFRLFLLKFIFLLNKKHGLFYLKTS